MAEFITAEGTVVGLVGKIPEAPKAPAKETAQTSVKAEEKTKKIVKK